VIQSDALAVEPGDYPVTGLVLEDKVRLLTGADSWRTRELRSLGLRSLVTSDGPAGVRGATLDETHPSASLPCPSALGATWDEALVRELAAALGREARSKEIDVLLAPTVNLMRTPLAGRGFEFFSEDPVLTARIAVAFVRGVQSAGVAATAKHFVANDSETGRWDYDVRVAEHVLREAYLVPFEACVRDADVGLVMASYNSVNGTSMTEHTALLSSVLKDEWGFSGVVVPDWGAARSTEGPALAGLDLVMPGPAGPWNERLVEAVRNGKVPERLIDEKLRRILRLADHVGPQDNRLGAARPDLVGPELLRRAAAASFVLLRNDGDLLPLDPAALESVALMGPNAVRPVTQGAGSVAVIPAGSSRPADALRSALAGTASVIVAPGCDTSRTVHAPEPGTLRDPVSGEPGIRIEYWSDGVLVAEQHRIATTRIWWDDLPDGFGWGQPGQIVMRTVFRADKAGSYVLGAAAVGHLTLMADSVIVAEGDTPVPDEPVEAMVRPGEVRAAVSLSAGQRLDVEIRYQPAARGEAPVSLRLGMAPQTEQQEMLAEALEAARRAEVAVVVVGSAEGMETEGIDRTTLRLPGGQDELVSRVAEVNERTVVVVNTGMPVLMPWADQVKVILQVWLPGQSMGAALADVLLGKAEPGGRLPVTMPAAESDCPILHAVPERRRLAYDEGLFIGYRGYDLRGVAPLFPFGHGLGYTTWVYESLDAAATLATGSDLEVSVRVRNSGPRPGREVVQVYLAPVRPEPGRPVRTLAAYGTATARPGEVAVVRIWIPARAFSVFDDVARRWICPARPFLVEIGRSSRDLRLSTEVAVAG
jgi:beta-glucosidase